MTKRNTNEWSRSNLVDIVGGLCFLKTVVFPGIQAPHTAIAFLQSLETTSLASMHVVGCAESQSVGGRCWGGLPAMLETPSWNFVSQPSQNLHTDK